jgi:hypothetical protein
MKLRSLEEFAKVFGTLQAAKKELDEAQIPVVEGYFDYDRYRAHVEAPAASRIKSMDWELSSTHGIGAVKSCVQAAGLHLTAHYLNGNRNRLDIMTREGAACHTRMFYSNHITRNLTTATFSIRNFTKDHPSTRYVFAALPIPCAWAFTQPQLKKIWERLRFNSKHKVDSTHLDAPTGFWIPGADWRGQDGALRFRLSCKESKHQISPETLGLK